MPGRRSILLIDGDADHRTFLRGHFEGAGFAVREAETPEQGLPLAANQCHLAVLDTTLLGVEAFELVRRLRAAPGTGALPVILLGHGMSEADRVRGFEAGADDYLARQVSPRELVARARAILRRAMPQAGETPSEVFERGRLRVDFDGYEAFVDGKRVPLSLREFELLKHFLRNPHRVHDRLSLLDAVWGPERFPEPRSIDVHIRRLRKAIECDDARPKVILTVRGVGYRCDPDALDDDATPDD